MLMNCSTMLRLADFVKMSILSYSKLTSHLDWNHCMTISLQDIPIWIRPPALRPNLFALALRLAPARLGTWLLSWRWVGVWPAFSLIISLRLANWIKNKEARSPVGYNIAIVAGVALFNHHPCRHHHQFQFSIAVLLPAVLPFRSLHLRSNSTRFANIFLDVLLRDLDLAAGFTLDDDFVLEMVLGGELESLVGISDYQRECGMLHNNYTRCNF